MPDTSAALAEPFVSKSWARTAHCERRVLTRITFVIALGNVMLWSHVGLRHPLAITDSVIAIRLALQGATARSTVHSAGLLHEWRGLRHTPVHHRGQPLVSTKANADDDYRIVTFDVEDPFSAESASTLEEKSPLLYHPPAPRIVAVGDLHGDFQACRSVLEMAGLAIHGQWTGGDSVLVVLGDVLDRGHEELEILVELKSLKEQARKVGGAVITLLGNHEILNLGGDMRYVAREAMNVFGPDRRAAFAPGGYLASELADWPVAAIVGDNVFIHGGLPRDATADTLEQMNVDTRSWMLGHVKKQPRALWPINTSPVWLREQSVPPGREPSMASCLALRQVLSRLGASRLVVGHTPQDCVNCACNGLVWRIDTGMAVAMGSGAVEALEIVGDEVRVINADNPHTGDVQKTVETHGDEHTSVRSGEPQLASNR